MEGRHRPAGGQVWAGDTLVERTVAEVQNSEGRNSEAVEHRSLTEDSVVVGHRSLIAGSEGHNFEALRILCYPNCADN